MHKFRAAARSAAWYDEEGDEPNYNPFKKIHRRNQNVSYLDEENAQRIPTNRSENRIGLTSEVQRRSQQIEDGDTSSPRHASTMPSTSSRITSIKQNAFLNPTETEATTHSKEVSNDSGNATSETMTELPQENGFTDGMPRQRKGFMQKMHFKKPESSASAPKRRKKPGLFAKDKQNFTIMSQIRATLLNSWINILLIFVPIGIAVNYAHIPQVGIFVINFIAIIPLAAMLSFATEEIALRVGETLGGLLNATFGNAVELIVSVLALTKNEVDIVQQSLIGSMLSNLLLVMGMCFFFGGISREKQHFNVTVAQTASSLLALAVGSLIIPAAFFQYADGSEALKESRITMLSRGLAILLLLVYGCYLLFQLKTHSTMYNAPSKKVEKRNKKIQQGAMTKSVASMGANMSATMGGSAAQEKPTRDPDAKSEDDDEEEHEKPQLSKLTAILTLAISTALVAICAEYMVSAIDGITEGGAVSRQFVGLILLPIVGNAAEHATAVTVAVKDKMDLSIGVAVGSSMQIALLIIPFMVVLGWILGKDDMNLAFDGFQIIVLFVSILLVNYLIQDGESHWLEGVLLQTLYVIIAVAAWFYPPDDPNTNNAR